MFACRAYSTLEPFSDILRPHGRRERNKRGDGYWAYEVIKVVIYDNPDGKYLVTGGGPDVWHRFGVSEAVAQTSGPYSRQSMRQYGEHRP
jgi:hypothetical protein